MDDKGSREYFGERLIHKAEICRITGLSFPSLWKMMQQGAFPRSRSYGAEGSRCVWLESEIKRWIQGLPKRVYKGDEPDEPQDDEESAGVDSPFDEDEESDEDEEPP